MKEYLDEAKEELKRVDHIIYVSLKYTRTVDIIRNAIIRLVSAYDYIIEALFIYNKNQKKIEHIPKSPKEKLDALVRMYPEDKKLVRYLALYSFLRELIKAQFTRREEYRRHVTMISQLKNQTAETDIDVLEDNYDKEAKEFLEYAELLMDLRPHD